jgi:hypothetical protein
MSGGHFLRRESENYFTPTLDRSEGIEDVLRIQRNSSAQPQETNGISRAMSGSSIKSIISMEFME